MPTLPEVSIAIALAVLVLNKSFEVKSALSEWLNPEDEQAQTHSENTATVSAGDTKKVEDVNQAFDELFNK